MKWLCVAILFLLITQLIFSIPAPFWFLEAVWGAGDFITFVSTTFLGYIAISQSYLANKTNISMQETNERMHMLQLAQIVSIIAVKGIYIQKRLFEEAKTESAIQLVDETISLDSDDSILLSNEHYWIDITFENRSKYPIASLITCPHNISPLFYGIKNVDRRAIYIADEGISCIRLIIPSAILEECDVKKIAFRWQFINIFKQHTEATLFIDDLTLHKPRYDFRLSLYKNMRKKES
ncbi:MAG: hypothetical protein FWC92_03845 [Defluviitaleaceae bacterium]|nr:hypothetical protein [Defluviitaleaceae bacterium]